MSQKKPMHLNSARQESPPGLNAAQRLRDKVALVTGGASGIGRAIAQRFAAEGAAVAIADAEGAGARKLATALTGEGTRARAIAVDVTDEGAVGAMVRETVRELGGLDILVTSAGVGGRAPLAQFPLEMWNRIIAVNLTGTFLCTRAAAAHMIGQGSGNIIHISSIFGQRGIASRAAYCASKGGVISLMQSAAVELAAHGIRVNAISPNGVKTPMSDRLHTPAIREAFIRWTPMRRYGLPEEMAAAAAFLASDDAAYITGHELSVDGGYAGAGLMFEEGG